VVSLGKTASIVLAVVITAIVVASIMYVAVPKGGQMITQTVTVTKTEIVTQTITATQVVTTTTPTQHVKAAIIIRKRGDLGFNDMAWLGGQMAVKNLGAEVEYFYYENVPMAQYLEFLENIVRKGFDIIVVVNFMMAEQVAELADKYPNQKFAILDAIVEGKPNVMSIVFKENEGSALVGALATYLSKSSTVGIVLGMDIPPLWKFEIGYKWGIHYVMNETGRKVKILWEYVGTFGDPNKGKEAATLMLQQGADVVYHAAGETGLGVIDAVYDYSQKTGKKVYAIGVDAPQEWIRSGYVIASMVKHVEVAVYKAIEDVAKGSFKGGVIALGIKEGGVDISKPEDIKIMMDIAVELNLMRQDEANKVYNEVMNLRNSIPNEVWDKVMLLREKIIHGEVSIPIPTADTIAELRQRYG